MATSPTGYSTLLKRNSRGSLWLGDDHLLVIENSSFLLCVKETYRRLDYANIQAVLQAPSPSGALITAVLAIMTVLTALPALTISGNAPEDSFLRTLSVIWSAVSLLLLIVNLFKGPTVSLVVLTAVRSWRLRPVTRASHAAKVIEALLPRCQQAQQHLAIQETSATPALAWPAYADQTAGGAHRLAIPCWICLLAAAIMLAGETIWNHQMLSLLMIMLGCTFLVLLMICFSRGGGTRGCGGRGWFFTSLGLITLNTIGLYAFVMFDIMRDALNKAPGKAALEQASALKALAAFPSYLPQEVMIGALVSAGITALVAIGAMLAVLRLNAMQRRREQHSDQPA